MTRPFLDVVCPKCQASIGERCRTLKTRRVTDTHIDRITAPRPRPTGMFDDNR